MTDASIDDLIDGLADDLKPIRPRRLLRGGAWTAAAWLIGGGTLLWLLGMRIGQPLHDQHQPEGQKCRLDHQFCTAGAAGAAVLALHCSSDNMVHIALWHGLVVILSAIAGRLILPPLLRW